MRVMLAVRVTGRIVGQHVQKPGVMAVQGSMIGSHTQTSRSSMGSNRTNWTYTQQ
jgi:hypothetical protein